MQPASMGTSICYVHVDRLHFANGNIAARA
jgi:hypothetical protein